MKQATTPRRHDEQNLHMACVDWLFWASYRYKILEKTIHVPNGGYRRKTEAAILKRMGVKPGFPDIFNPMTSGRWKGLAIELKSASGTVTPQQQEWLNTLRQDGYLTGLARTLDEFIVLAKRYVHSDEFERKNAK